MPGEHINMDRTGTYSDQEFNDIFKRYWGKVFGIAYKYTRNAELSKEIVQNVFISLWRREEPLREDIAIQKYLTQAAKFQVFKSFRASRHNSLAPLDSAVENESEASYDPFQRYLYSEMNTGVQELISRMNEPARTIFRLSRFEMLTHKEIALRLGLHIKTVEYHISQSLKLLRKYIK
jgi:RNA polymerase sigma-70 factor, ECF subfamily